MAMRFARCQCVGGARKTADEVGGEGGGESLPRLSLMTELVEMCVITHPNYPLALSCDCIGVDSL